MYLESFPFRRSLPAGLMAAVILLAGCGRGTSGPEAQPEAAPTASLSIEKTEGKIDVMAGGKVLTALYYGANWDKPFLFPLRSASGVTISRGFPVEPQPGESSDHKWHRGIWYGHGDVSGEDFWRELGADKSGKLVVQGTPEASASDSTAAIRFTAFMQGREPEKKRYGSIDEGYIISLDGNKVVIDASIAVHADAGMDLKFGDTDDGGFGFRLSDAYREDRVAKMINSEGKSGSKEMWGKPARWVDYAAEVEETIIGFAAFDSPSNLRHPTGWHARGYSLCSANPFAAGSFAEDKSIDGSYTLKSGDTLDLKYRVVIHEGAFQPSDVEDWYEAWTKGS